MSGVPLPDGRGGVIIFLRNPEDTGGKVSVYVVRWSGRGDPSVETLDRPLTLPGIFAVGGPVAHGRFRPGVVAAVGHKHNAGHSALSYLRLDSAGRPQVEEQTFSELGLGDPEVILVADVDGDGTDELILGMRAGAILVLTAE